MCVLGPPDEDILLCKYDLIVQLASVSVSVSRNICRITYHYAKHIDGEEVRLGFIITMWFQIKSIEYSIFQSLKFRLVFTYFVPWLFPLAEYSALTLYLGYFPSLGILHFLCVPITCFTL